MLFTQLEQLYYSSIDDIIFLLDIASAITTILQGYKSYAYVEQKERKKNDYPMSTDSVTVVLIIGGGLGGLALAQLLSQNSSSIKVLIFERDENEYSREQGYCIGIDPTGLNVLHKIRVLNDLLSDQSNSYVVLSSFRIVNRYLQKCFDINAGECKLIYRNELRRALLTNLNVQWNKRFVSYKVLDDGVEAYFEDGTSIRGTILIGCDGAKSVVRSQLLPNFQRTDLQVVNIGSTTEQADDLKKIQNLTRNSLVRILGLQGHTLLILPFRNIYMWALSWKEEGPYEEENLSKNQLIDKARRFFRDDEVVRLIERSSSTYLGPYHLYTAQCLKTNPFPNHLRVTLLGDAAHPMTTHAGKGANTAFADAEDLANVFQNLSLQTLSQYEQKMFKRGYAAVKMSLNSTQMIHATGWHAAVRDGIFSIIRYISTLISLITMPLRYWNRKKDA